MPSDKEGHRRHHHHNNSRSSSGNSSCSEDDASRRHRRHHRRHAAAAAADAPAVAEHEQAREIVAQEQQQQREEDVWTSSTGKQVLRSVSVDNLVRQAFLHVARRQATEEEVAAVSKEFNNDENASRRLPDIHRAVKEYLKSLSAGSRTTDFTPSVMNRIVNGTVGLLTQETDNGSQRTVSLGSGFLTSDDAATTPFIATTCDSIIGGQRTMQVFNSHDIDYDDHLWETKAFGTSQWVPLDSDTSNRIEWAYRTASGKSGNACVRCGAAPVGLLGACSACTAPSPRPGNCGVVSGAHDIVQDGFGRTQVTAGCGVAGCGSSRSGSVAAPSQVKRRTLSSAESVSIVAKNRIVEVDFDTMSFSDGTAIRRSTRSSKGWKSIHKAVRLMPGANSVRITVRTRAIGERKGNAPMGSLALSGFRVFEMNDLVGTKNFVYKADLRKYINSFQAPNRRFGENILQDISSADVNNIVMKTEGIHLSEFQNPLGTIANFDLQAAVHPEIVGASMISPPLQKDRDGFIICLNANSLTYNNGLDFILDWDDTVYSVEVKHMWERYFDREYAFYGARVNLADNNPSQESSNELILRTRVAGIDFPNNIALLAFDDTDPLYTPAVATQLLSQTMPLVNTNGTILDSYSIGTIVMGAARSFDLQQAEVSRGILASEKEYFDGVSCALQRFSLTMSSFSSGGPICMQGDDDFPYVVSICNYWSIPARVQGVIYDTLSASLAYIANKWPAALEFVRSGGIIPGEPSTMDPSQPGILLLDNGVQFNLSTRFPLAIYVPKIDFGGVWKMVSPSDRWDPLYQQLQTEYLLQRTNPKLLDRHVLFSRGRTDAMCLIGKRSLAFDTETYQLAINDMAVKADVEMYDNITGKPTFVGTVTFGYGPSQVDIWFLEFVINNNPLLNKVNSIYLRQWNQTSNTYDNLIKLDVNLTSEPSFFNLSVPNFKYYETGDTPASETTVTVPRHLEPIRQRAAKPPSYVLRFVQNNALRAQTVASFTDLLL